MIMWLGGPSFSSEYCAGLELEWALKNWNKIAQFSSYLNYSVRFFDVFNFQMPTGSYFAHDKNTLGARIPNI